MPSEEKSVSQKIYEALFAPGTEPKEIQHGDVRIIITRGRVMSEVGEADDIEDFLQWVSTLPPLSEEEKMRLLGDPVGNWLM